MSRDIRINKLDLIKSAKVKERLTKENFNPNTKSRHIINTYEEAMAFIDETANAGITLGLSGIRHLCDKFDNIQDNLRIIHVAGTNGKGSVISYLTSIFESAGLKVGRYTSPAVFDYRERFYITNFSENGWITKEELTSQVEKVSEAYDKIINEGKDKPSQFEVETCMAFNFFNDNYCDIVLLECGMGGEGDATNVVQAPVCSVFTSISMDHMAFLGNSLKSITEDKAGIIKYGFPVISQIQPGEVKEVIINKAQEKMSKVIFAGKYSGKTGIEGPGQDDNAGLAMEVATFVLKEILGRDYESMKEYFDDCIIKGIESAVNPGRFQKIFADKEIYMDGAHNEDASVKLKTFLEMYFTNRPIIFIMGVLKDKDYKSICRNLCSVAYKMITITPQNARGLDGQILLDTIREINKDVAFGSYSYENAANEAISLYNDLSEKGKEPVMLVCGSLSILSDMREIFKGKEKSVN